MTSAMRWVAAARPVSRLMWLVVNEGRCNAVHLENRMNVLIRASAALAVAALVVLGTASPVRADGVVTAELGYDIYDFYNPTELLRDGSIRVTARNQATGESFTADERSGNVFTVPVGTYTFTGRSQWCYLQETTIEIAAETTRIALYAGCE